MTTKGAPEPRPTALWRRVPHQVPTGWRLVVVVGGLSVFGPLCIDMYLPGLPSISRDLHSSASEVQLTLTACMIGISLGQLLLGPISDRLGRRPPLLAGLAAFVASSVACASAGAASAVLGSFQFLVASVAAPLAGVGGTADALPMAVLILASPAAGLGCRLFLAGTGDPRPSTIAVES